MPPLATVDDVAARWRPLSSEEARRAAVLLGDASAIVRATVPGIEDRPHGLVVAVVAGIVKRAMIGAENGDGIGSQQHSAGPFTQSVTFTNPTGALYLTKHDRRLLGAPSGRAFSIELVA